MEFTLGELQVSSWESDLCGWNLKSKIMKSKIIKD